MSHYAVAVFHRRDQQIEDLLAPYDENLEVEPYIKFSRQEAIEFARKHYKDFDSKSDEECWQFMVDEDTKTDSEGNIYSTYNPKSKWDWYQEGGRWSGLLKGHGVESDEALVRDIDFGPDLVKYAHALRFWDVVVDHQPLKPNETEDDYFNFYKEEYYRERYGDRETYARYIAQFSTFAVVTPDGEWHEKGEMGWFGCSSDTAEDERDWEEHYKERFIDTADPDWILTIVDCHI